MGPHRTGRRRMGHPKRTIRAELKGPRRKKGGWRVATMAMETSVTVIRAEAAESAKPEVAGFVEGFLVRHAAALDQIDIGSLRGNAFLLPKLRWWGGQAVKDVIAARMRTRRMLGKWSCPGRLGRAARARHHSTWRDRQVAGVDAVYCVRSLSSWPSRFAETISGDHADADRPTLNRGRAGCCKKSRT